jgi:glycerophosphoryl diester phosphodiesterase
LEPTGPNKLCFKEGKIEVTVTVFIDKRKEIIVSLTESMFKNFKNRANKFHLIWIGLSCMLFSCNKSEQYPDVQIFGHAGMGVNIAYSVYHDNSEEAIDLALSLPNMDGVEMDIRMSKDGTLWLFHDSRLEFSTNGSGCFDELTDQEIEQFHYKSPYKERLVRLETILTKLKDGQTFILDIKHWNGCAQPYSDMVRFKDALLAIPDSLKNKLIIDSSYPHWLSSISQVYKVVFSTLSYEAGLSKSQEIPTLYGLMMRSKDMSADQISNIKSLGKTVFLYEMRSSKMQRATMKKAPTAILSDDPRGALIIRD